MDLVEDYLRAVGALLPRAQREDIVAELRDTVLSRIEGRQEEIGRPLTPDEVEAVLREIGHPLVVAARFRDGPQTIVGPALYPFWLFAVRAAVGIQLCLSVLILIVRSLGGAYIGQALGQAFASAITGSATLIGFITAAAWLIERQAHKPEYLSAWRVKDLRYLELGAWDVGEWRTRFSGPRAPRAAASRREHWRSHERSQVGRGLLVIVAAGVGLLWWAGALHFGFSASPEAIRAAGLAPGDLAGFDWEGLKAQVFWPVAAYLLVTGFWGFSLMARPFARRVHGAFDLLMGGACLLFVAWAASATALAPVLGQETPPELAFDVLVALRGGPPFPLWAAVVVVAGWTLLIGVVRLVRGTWLVIDPPSLLGHPRPA